MAKVFLANHIQERPEQNGADQPERAGPFITISREFGCWGFSLGLLLLDILNERTSDEHAWRIYHKEILDRLASETNMASDVLEKQRREKPRLLADFLRSLSGEKVPSGMEVRNRMNTIIRGLAIGGYAIIVGQGGAGATVDLEGGLSIRLVAPETWRVQQVAFREGLSETQAKLRIQAKEREQDYLRKLYERRFPKRPPFSLVYDCSVFTLAQIAQHVVYGMELKGMTR